MPFPLAIPDGYTSRPVVMDDSTAVTALVAAEELHDLGEVAIEEADYVSDWQKPSFDLATRTIASGRDDRSPGSPRWTHDRGDAAVHPDHRRRGIGTALAGWMQGLARANGMSVIGAPVPQGKAGDQLLEKLGYRVRWTSWVLELLDGATVPDRPLPEGYAVREATPADYEAVWTTTEDAFLEWSDRERQTFEDWRPTVPGRPGFEPWNIRVATDPGRRRRRHVDRPRQHRRRADQRLHRPAAATRRTTATSGLAQALLVDSFAVGHEHGAYAPSSPPTRAPARSASTRRSACR